MKRPRWLVLAAALAAAALTARLGLWQLDRAGQKRQVQSSIESRAGLPPLAAAGLARDPQAAELQHYRSVRVTGRWLHRHTVYLDNRPLEGRSGFLVVTPLQLAPGDAVLVQRGWMPRDMADRTRLQPLPEPHGEVVVHGQIAPEPSKLIELGTPSPGPIRQNLDLAAMSREIGQSLRPLSLRLLDGPDTAADGLLRQWQAAKLDPGKNFGYAFQWFALCALIIGLYVWYQLLRPGRNRLR